MRRALLALGATSWVAQRVGEARDRRRYPPPGQLVDVGGRSLHVVDHGGPGPVVVVETGSGALALGWNDVAAELSGDARVITYDRPGYGWSDAAGWRHTGGDVARDLRALLAAIDAPPPYVLVGHSLGGLYVRCFADLYPDDVGGMVLVDSSHEDMVRHIRNDHGDALVVAQAVAGVATAGFPRGLARLLVASGLVDSRLASVVGGDGVEESRMQANLYLRSAFRQAMVAEFVGMGPTFTSLRARRRALTIPVAVVTAAAPESDATSVLGRIRPVWEKLQADLATLSSDSTHVVASTGGHFVHHDDPAVVVGAIREVVNKVAGAAAAR